MQCFGPKCSQQAELSADASNLERTENTTKLHTSKFSKKYSVSKLCDTNSLSIIQSGPKKNV